MLSKKLAQNIVDKMMDVIPYNVNIMNDKGIIIGSGDIKRIGQIHNGALEALERNEIVEILEDEEEIKAGVNIPILFREKIVGVIGITGLPNVVKHLGKLVSVTTELLINQEYSISEHIISEKLKEEFIYEWINYEDNYNENFIEKGKSFGVDVLLRRAAILVEYNEADYKKCSGILSCILDENEYMVNLSSHRIVILINEINISRKIKNIKERLKNICIKMAVGRVNSIIYKSVKDSIKALELGGKLYKDISVYYYSQIQFYHDMDKFFCKEKQDRIIELIRNESKNEDLLETFLAFMECSGERTAAAKTIHIHRNTLNYRLKKIEEITKLSFDNYIELFQLMKSYLNYKIY
ncbi:MAG: sugar diacid recognition domain-containing protein [Clostridium sp.]|nr:sugar diacid recognition domain-containing protein [Clostridium sp.]